MLYKNLDKVLRRYCDDLEDQLKDFFSKSRSSGNLMDSISCSVTKLGVGWEVEIDMAAYAQYVIDGRKPGKFPPVNNILKWIKQKPILPRARNGKLPTQEQLAFMIGRKIAKKGIKGKEAEFDSIIDNINDEWAPKIASALGKVIVVELVSILD